MHEIKIVRRFYPHTTMSEPDKSLDLLGVEPLSKSIEIVTSGMVGGVGAFLSRICLPAAEEFGLLLRDRVSAWRAQNVLGITSRAERLIYESAGDQELQAHPRIVAGVIELGSWSDAKEVQQMWAGLLASACTPDGRDDSNLIFLDILSKLTVSQARLFDYICRNANKVVAPAGWISADMFLMSLDELKDVTGLSDFHRIDLELDHLRALSLLSEVAGGFDRDSTEANMTPTALALQMFVRCQGSTSDPITFYGVQPPPQQPKQ
jgi:Abortive infection alpha